jgi:DNA-binding transcriptional ArsR family regulator
MQLYEAMAKTKQKTTSDDAPGCNGHDHTALSVTIDTEACERAAAIFRALGDPQRLRILVLLEASERCVTEVCELLNEPMPAISQRLRLLKSERIVRSRRAGKHIYYALADDHISRLVTNAVMHAMELA